MKTKLRPICDCVRSAKYEDAQCVIGCIKRILNNKEWKQSSTNLT